MKAALVIAALFVALPAFGQSQAELADQVRAACSFMYDPRSDPNQFAYCLTHFSESLAAYKKAHGR